MFGIKTKEQRVKEQRERILEKYIYECRKLGFTDKVIIDKLKTINAPNEFLVKHFELNDLQEVNKQTMPKPIKEKDYEEEDDEVVETEEEQEDSRDEDDDNEEEVEEEHEEKPKKKIVKKEETKEKQPEVNMQQLIDVLQNQEQRIRNIEATLFRRL